MGGEDKEFLQCNTHTCTVDQDCAFSHWSVWSDCSCTLNGVKRRSRRIVSYGKGKGDFCNGNTKEITGCNFIPVPSKPKVPCSWGGWSEWSKCSAMCGAG